MGKLRAARVRLVAAEPRLTTLDRPNHLSPDAREREAMYQSDKWWRVRRGILDRMGAKPEQRRCQICGAAKANQIDHLLGHSDSEADELAFCLSMDVPAHWRDRFFTGPFILLCHGCHSRKTMYEKRGQLLQWAQNHWEILKQFRPSA